MENELALGQRTGKMILVDSSWSDEELKLVADNEISLEDVIRQWVLTGGDETLNSAIGAAKQYREPGTVPAEVLAPETVEVAPVEATADAASIPSDLTSPTETTL